MTEPDPKPPVKPCENSQTCLVWEDRKKPCPDCGRQVLLD